MDLTSFENMKVNLHGDPTCEFCGRKSGVMVFLKHRHAYSHLCSCETHGIGLTKKDYDNAYRRARNNPLIGLIYTSPHIQPKDLW